MGNISEIKTMNFTFFILLYLTADEKQIIAYMELCLQFFLDPHAYIRLTSEVSPLVSNRLWAARCPGGHNSYIPWVLSRIRCSW